MAKNERGILPNNMAKQRSPGNGTLSNDPGHGIAQLKEASSQIIWPGKIFLATAHAPMINVTAWQN